MKKLFELYSMLAAMLTLHVTEPGQWRPGEDNDADDEMLATLQRILQSVGRRRHSDVVALDVALFEALPEQDRLSMSRDDTIDMQEIASMAAYTIMNATDKYLVDHNAPHSEDLENESFAYMAARAPAAFAEAWKLHGVSGDGDTESFEAHLAASGITIAAAWMREKGFEVPSVA